MSDLTSDEVSYLLYLKTGTRIPDDIDDSVKESLINRGYVYSSNRVQEQLTMKAKHRIGNHILKERNLPDYVSKYSMPVAFDKFFETASINAVNAMLMSLLSSNIDLTKLNSMTIQRLQQALTVEPTVDYKINLNLPDNDSQTQN